MSYALGIDIGGTNIKSVCVSREGALLSRRTTPTEDMSHDALRDAKRDASREEVRARWIELVRALCEDAQREHGELQSLGISAPGLAARDERSIAWMMGRMEAVMELDWTHELPWKSIVPVLNDAQAALVGEVWAGAARGERDCILLTLGTGVGGAVMCDGSLLRGRIGRAGHLGHISLDPDGALDIVATPGSLEDAIGECTLAVRSNNRFASTEDLVRAHLGGDEHATRIWMASVRALAAGVVSLVNALDPSTVIIGGGVARAGNALFEPLQVLLDRWEWRPTGSGVRVVQAQLGDFAGAFGAAQRALELEI